MARPRGVLSLYLCALLSLLTISVRVNAHAPGDPTLSQGLKPYGAYSGGDVDLVSFENGKLDLHIPLFSYPSDADRERARKPGVSPGGGAEIHELESTPGLDRCIGGSTGPRGVHRRDQLGDRQNLAACSSRSGRNTATRRAGCPRVRA
jgi:hypothetical protein